MTSPEAKPRILIADDNEDLAKIMGVVLTQAGFEVHAVFNGKDALEWLAHQTPDVLILDLMMPDVSGFTILRQLRASESTSPLPVIVLTARKDQESRTESESAGANAFVTKPLNSKALVEHVRQALALKGDGPRPPAIDQPAPSPSP
jgi:DNA-binding response OmpR family regulator